MARFLYHIHSFTIRRCGQWSLAFSWILGLGVGGLAFRYAGDNIVSLMPLVLSSQLSIVSLIFPTVLPFLLAAFAVYISWPRLLLPICAGKAFAYSYVASAAVSCSTGGWLLRWLVLFADSWVCVLLYGYARRHITGLRCFSFPEFLGFFGGILLVCAVDIGLISPFLRQLLS